MKLPHNPPRTLQLFVVRRAFRVLVVEKALFGMFKKINVFLGYFHGCLRREKAIARLGRRSHDCKSKQVTKTLLS